MQNFQIILWNFCKKSTFFFYTIYVEKQYFRPDKLFLSFRREYKREAAKQKSIFPDYSNIFKELVGNFRSRLTIKTEIFPTK